MKCKLVLNKATDRTLKLVSENNLIISNHIHMRYTVVSDCNPTGFLVKNNIEQKPVVEANVALWLAPCYVIVHYS